MRPPPKTTHVVTELLAVTASRSPPWPGQTWSNLSFDNQKPSRGVGLMPRAGPAINSLCSLTGNRTAEFRPVNIPWLCLDSLSPSWCASIHDGYRALANPTSSDRVVIRLFAVTNDDL
jgi:hypothetical protein